MCRNGDDPKRTAAPPAADATGAAANPKPKDRVPRSSRKVGGPASAFDIWLDRDLHRMFDKVRAEPIPEELLRLIDLDRKKS